MSIAISAAKRINRIRRRYRTLEDWPVMNGFYLPYALDLLWELKWMTKENRIFKNGPEAGARQKKKRDSEMTPLAYAIARELGDPIHFTIAKRTTPEQVNSLIETAEQFCGIFERRMDP